MVFRPPSLEFKDMAQDPLPHVTDGRMRVWSHTKYSLYPKEHPVNCPLRWRLNNGLDCKLYLVTIQGNLTGDQYIRDV